MGDVEKVETALLSANTSLQPGAFLALARIQAKLEQVEQREKELRDQLRDLAQANLRLRKILDPYADAALAVPEPAPEPE